MIYTAEEKSRMDKLLAAFADYIVGHKNFDILYSDKSGFVYISYYMPGRADGAVTINDFDNLLVYLFDEMALDAYLTLDPEGAKNTYPLLPEVIEELRNRVEPIINTLVEDRVYCMGALNMFINEYKK